MRMANIFRKIFGFSFGGDVNPNIPTPVTPSNLDSSIDITATSHAGLAHAAYTGIDVNQVANTENELIEQYRQLAYVPEVDRAIVEITSEAIIVDKQKKIVTIDLDEIELPQKIKEVIVSEHDEVLRLLSFSKNGYELFKRWYVDGRLNFNVLIDSENPNAGIAEMRYIDPRKIKRVRELIKQLDPATQVEMIQGVKEYYLFSDQGVSDIRNASGSIIMTKESIVHVNSGLHDPSTNVVMSYLHNAIRPSNNLRMMEDAMLIYRLARAPERRVFKVFTGNLPKAKAEQYVQEIANKYRNKVTYDVNTGEIKADKRYLAMTEDFWLPVGDGGQGIGIDTLPGGEAVGETGESDYFKKKLYESLRVPNQRMTEENSMFSSGTEITRDEVRFSRFINLLRKRFSGLFLETLKRNLILKGILDEATFDNIADSIRYEFQEDNYFSESVEYGVINQRIAILQQIDPFVGKYVSREYVFQNILHLTEEERDKMIVEIEQDRQTMMMQEIQEQNLRIQAGIVADPVPDQQQAESIQPITTPMLSESSDERNELDKVALGILRSIGAK
jgi:hypothetical protein